MNLRFLEAATEMKVAWDGLSSPQTRRDFQKKPLGGKRSLTTTTLTRLEPNKKQIGPG
jgi:hypothetical protein